MANSIGSTRALLHPFVCTLLLFAAGARAAPGSGVVLPALTETPSGEHHVGKLVWADLVTPDLDAAKRFYGGLFGWTFREVAGDSHYVLALLGGEPIAGVYQKAMRSSQVQQPAWLTFLAVRDADAAKLTVLQHGGKVLSEPRDYPQRGRQAVFSDPDGATFAVLATNNDDPPDSLAPPGDWIWSSLHVTDPKQELAFYKTLFGYEVYELPDGGEARHFILSGDEYARAGLNALPSDAKRRRPHWLNFVRVTDSAETAAKAVSLGGRVLVEPRIDRHGGRLAVLADPSGAPFGVMEWSDDDTKQEPK